MASQRQRVAHRMALLGAATGALLLIPATVASSAPATVTDFVVVHEAEIFTASAFCLPEELLGTVTTQEISTGRSIKTSSGNFVVQGVDDFSYRIDFPDGSYVQAGIDMPPRASLVPTPGGAVLRFRGTSSGQQPVIHFRPVCWRVSRPV